MSIIGYARVSSTDQDLTLQLEALKAAKCDVIRSEKVSGTSTAGRAELTTIMEFIGQGDTLVVTRIDRLARSIGDLQDIVRALKTKGATLRVIEQPIDTSTAAGKAFLDMLGVFAEFETNLRRERQLEGIAKAKAKGAYKGRKRSIDAATVRDLQAKGRGPTEIAKTLGIGRASVYRVIGNAKPTELKPDPLCEPFDDDAKTIAMKSDLPASDVYDAMLSAGSSTEPQMRETEGSDIVRQADANADPLATDAKHDSNLSARDIDEMARLGLID